MRRRKRLAEASHLDRQAAMRVLALAPAPSIAKTCAALPRMPEYACLRGPETGLVMVRGRAGGGGAPFNLGEVTVTRCTVRLSSGEVGHAYVMGRDGEKARLAAALDGMWQREDMRERVEADVIAPLKAQIEAADHDRAAQSAATKVDFFTMVRGED